jgi:hypothetical protein
MSTGKDPTRPRDRPHHGASQSGEFEGGSRGDLSGRNWEQSKAIGQGDPLAEGSRQGRERCADGAASGAQRDGQLVGPRELLQDKEGTMCSGVRLCLICFTGRAVTP